MRYYHWKHIPEQLLDYLIDLKVEIDMGNHDIETRTALKKEFNKRASMCDAIVPYPL